MKICNRFRKNDLARICLWRIFAAVLAILFTGQTSPAIGQEVENDGADNAIIVQIPEGLRRVRVLVRDIQSDAWNLYSLAHLDGRAGQLKLPIPPGVALGDIRVQTSGADRFPHSFYTRKHRFEESVTDSSGVISVGGPYGDLTLTADDSLAEAVIDFDQGDTRNADPAEVVESDIWKILGTTLYFFNQFRGLQVFDLADSSQPALRSTLRLPAAGEDLYVLDDTHVVLVAHTISNSLTEFSQVDNFSGVSELINVELGGPQPIIASRLNLPGFYNDSRLVGNVLYVVSQSNRIVEEDGINVFRPNYFLSAWDMSDPGQPSLLAELEKEGSVTVVNATGEHILVGTVDPETSGTNLTIFGLDVQNGLPFEITEVELEGAVGDKFKLQLRNSVLTGISQVWRSVGPGNRRITKLETFAIDERAKTATPLGELEIADNETLHATRFDGDRVYVVTFLQIDPLWVIDLSDPSSPQITGELEIPGWSTYIEPMGDRLLAIGVEERRVVVSLFDVADPSTPTRLEHVFLGEGFSWSEANYDEKAVKVLVDQGLALVPFQSFEGDSAVNAVQLIDFDAESLTKRGVIEHKFPPRRATALGEQLVSISNQELLVVEAIDRDNPNLLAELSIAWTTDRVFLAGDHLIQIEDGRFWASSGSILRVSPRYNPDHIITELILGSNPVIGADLKGNRLYLAQAEIPPFIPGNPDELPRLITTIFDVSNPENPIELGSVEEILEDRSYSFQVTALWTSEDVLIWHSGDNYVIYPWFLSIEPVVRIGTEFIDPILTATIVDFAPPYYSFRDRIQLIAVDVSLETQPAILSNITLQPEAAWRFSDPHLLDGDIFISYDTNRWLESDVITGSFLQVIDYSEPSAPEFSDPIGFPGQLEGLVEENPDTIVLYSRSSVRLPATSPFWPYSLNENVFQASVYDGVNVFLLDEIIFDSPHFAQVVFSKVHLYIAMAGDVAHESEIKHLFLNDDGQLEELPSLPIEGSVHDIAVLFDLLTVISLGQLSVADIENPFQIPPFQQFAISSVIGFNLDLAEVDRGEGIWMPAGVYGVERVALEPPSETVFISSLGALVESDPDHEPEPEPGLELEPEPVPDPPPLPPTLSDTQWIDLPAGPWERSGKSISDTVGILILEPWLFVSEGFQPFENAARDIGDGWKDSIWFGTYHDLANPWLYHPGHHWIFVNNNDIEAFWFWNDQLGWTWTGNTTYPYLYSVNADGWLWYQPESVNPAWYYNFAKGNWITF